MQYRRDLIPHPVGIPHQQVGARLPRVTPSGVARVHNRRLYSIERPAPENGAESLDGLGVWDNRSIKARSIGRAIDVPMPHVGTRSIRRPDFVLPTPNVSRVRQGFAFRDRSLQGLGDGPVPGSDNPGFWATVNSALSSSQVNALVNAGANFYVQKETGKDALSIAQAQARTAALQAQLAAQNASRAAPTSDTPSWVIPAVAVGGVALVGLIFFVSRKK